MKLAIRMASIFARCASGASSCTVVRTTVVVTPMLTPQARISAKKAQVGGAIHKPSRMAMRVVCISRKTRPGRRSGMTKNSSKVALVLPTVNTVSMLARNAPSPA